MGQYPYVLWAAFKKQAYLYFTFPFFLNRRSLPKAQQWACQEISVNGN
jgi:hypothetical protein